jgi:type IV fimbrial biogenesis protein FimT
MLSRRQPARRARGFSLIELLVAVALLALLLALAAPNFSTWVRNARIRTVAEALQSGVRLAQAEAQRRAHAVVFFRTSAKTCDANAVAVAGGLYWQVRVVPDALLTGDTAEPVQCGVLTDVSNGVTLSGPTTLCFSSDGRQTALTNPGSVGVDCALDALGAASSYDVSTSTVSAENRPLRILIALGGAIRMCDPKKSFPSAPDGCPAT